MMQALDIRSSKSRYAGPNIRMASQNVLRPEWQPLHDPVATLVYSATGASADTLIVDGRMIMEGRRVLTMDEEAVLRESQAMAESIARRAGLERLAAPRWPVF